MRLNHTQRQLLRTVGRLRYATVEHLLYWAEVSASSSITRALAPLRTRQLLEALPGLNPHAYQLTTTGARVIGARRAKRRSSFPVISNLCHRNSAEIALRAELPEARCMSREEVYGLGLVPSPAEHGFRVGNETVLVLVDDYFMPSSRLEVSWTRLHKKPQPGYYSVLRDGLKSWSAVASACFVFTTDAAQRERFEVARADLGVPAQVRRIAPLWGPVC